MNIIKAGQNIPIEGIKVLFYGEPSSGKTSLASSCKNPLLLDFDNGSYRSEYRKDVVFIKSWAEVANIKQDDLKAYDTIVMDTVGNALDYLLQFLITENPKLATRSGNPTIQGWGELKTNFISFLRKITTMGKDVIMIAHAKEKAEGEETRMRPDISGRSYDEVLKKSDFIGYQFYIGKERHIDFQPCDRFYGKDSANIGLVKIPNLSLQPDFGATLLAKMKNALNNHSTKQSQSQDRLLEEKSKIQAFTKIEHFNNALNEYKTQDYSAVEKKALFKFLSDKGEELNIVWLKDEGKFVDIAEIEAES